MKEDEELNRFLDLLRREQPESIDISRWKSAVRSELNKKKSNRRWLDMVAAAIIGIIVGAAAFGHRPAEKEEISLQNATSEIVVTKF